MNSASYRYILAFGSNLADKKNNLQQGLDALETIGRHEKLSRWLETAPLRSPHYTSTNHDFYINFITEFVTLKRPSELYSFIEATENEIGHCRVGKWLPRELDIDILFCGLNVSNDFSECIPVRYKGRKDLEIPHSDFWNRDFLIDLCTHDMSLAEDTLKRHSFSKLF